MVDTKCPLFHAGLETVLLQQSLMRTIRVLIVLIGMVNQKQNTPETITAALTVLTYFNQTSNGNQTTT